MIWQEVKLCLTATSSVGAEMLTAELVRLGISGWQVQSAQELRAYLQAEDAPFDYADAGLRAQAAALDNLIMFTLYLADDEQGQQQLSAIQQLAERTDANWGQLDVLVRQRSSEEWEDNWKQYYKPFKVGQRLVVCPSWEKYQPAADELLLMIEPGGSFGTGQHQTTRLCLELLEQYLTEYQQQHGCLPEKLLDLGCGTGILSIGGLLLGVNSAAAVDIEEHSAHAAAENAALNDIAPERYQTFWGNILDNRDILIRLKACADHGGYDIIVVNIVADVIIAMSSLFAGLLAEQGRVFCSGIIDNRRAEVLDAMREQGFKLQMERQDGGWWAMLFQLD